MANSKPIGNRHEKCVEIRVTLLIESNLYFIALDIYRLDNCMQNGSKEHDMNGILGVQLEACVIFISNDSSQWMLASYHQLKLKK